MPKPQPQYRQPQFLGTATTRAPEAPRFFGGHNERPEPALQVVAPPEPAPAPAPIGPRTVGAAPVAPPPELEREREALSGRVAAAVELLRAQAERLGEQVRADTVELAFQIARKILDAELEARPDAIFPLVRAAVRTLGETRHVVVRLATADAAHLEHAGADEVRRALAVAQVEVIADPALARGD